MSKVRVSSFSISIDGVGAGARQDLQNPLGVRGPEMFSWFFQTEVWNKMQGESGGGRGVDNQMAERAFENVGAWILGRNMFGPVRGPWPPHRTKHVPPQDPSADILERALSHLVVDASPAAALALHLVPDLRLKEPGEHLRPTHSERILQILPSPSPDAV